MRSRDPALVVLSAGCDGWAVSTNNSNLLRGVDLLSSLGGPLSALTTLAAAFLLGEEGTDPGVVDEVDGSSKGAEEDKVEEDTAVVLASGHRDNCLPRAAHGRITSEGRTGWWVSQQQRQSRCRRRP